MNVALTHAHFFRSGCGSDQSSCHVERLRFAALFCKHSFVDCKITVRALPWQVAHHGQLLAGGRHPRRMRAFALRRFPGFLRCKLYLQRDKVGMKTLDRLGGFLESCRLRAGRRRFFSTCCHDALPSFPVTRERVGVMQTLPIRVCAWFPSLPISRRQGLRQAFRKEKTGLNVCASSNTDRPGRVQSAGLVQFSPQRVRGDPDVDKAREASRGLVARDGRHVGRHAHAVAACALGFVEHGVGALGLRRRRQGSDARCRTKR